MADKTRPALIAQAIGITSAAYLSGSIFSLSAITIPALLSLRTDPTITHTALAKAWLGVFRYGQARMPPLSITAASCLAYSSYSLYRASGRATTSVKVLVCAGLATVAIIPWTLFFMSPTNAAIEAYATTGAAVGVEAVEARHVEELLGRWGWLNLARSLGPLTGAALAMSVLLDAW